MDPVTVTFALSCCVVRLNSTQGDDGKTAIFATLIDQGFEPATTWPLSLQRQLIMFVRPGGGPPVVPLQLPGAQWLPAAMPVVPAPMPAAPGAVTGPGQPDPLPAPPSARAPAPTIVSGTPVAPLGFPPRPASSSIDEQPKLDPSPNPASTDTDDQPDF